jgi:hypothetical protein
MYVNIWVMYIYEGMDFCGKDTLCFRNRESLMEISWPYRCCLSVSGHSIRRTPELERMFGMLHVGRDIRTIYHGSGSFDNGASSAEDENLLRWNLWVFGVPEAEGRDGDEAVDNASVYDGRVASGIQE